MCSYMDTVLGAVIHILRMMHAVMDRALVAVVLFVIHHFSPPFSGMVSV